MAKKENIKTDVNNGPQDINREIKTLRNWNWVDQNKNNKKGRDIITAGKFIDTGKVKGNITKIEGNSVFVEDLENGEVVKISIKDAIKSYKTSKDKKDIVSNISIEGPANASNGSIPKVGTSNAPKIDAKGTKAKEQTLANKNNPIASIKKFTDLANKFDSTTISGSKKKVNSEINGSSSKKDDKLMKANTNIKYVKSFSDHTELVSNPNQGKTVKSKENEIAKNLDSGKASKAEDNKIVKKITKVKSFTDLISKDIQTGPNEN